MSKFIQVQTAIFDRKKALEIAEGLVKNRLAGCVQILGPMDSFYLWKGKFIKDKEYLLIIKTEENMYKEVEDQIKKIHSYEVPEILALPIVNGNEKYLAWLGEVTSQ